jgi:hypothetical protein
MYTLNIYSTYTPDMVVYAADYPTLPQAVKALNRHCTSYPGAWKIWNAFGTLVRSGYPGTGDKEPVG